jgi:hypothetical protein
VDLLCISLARDIGEGVYVIERVDGDAIAWFDSPGAEAGNQLADDLPSLSAANRSGGVIDIHVDLSVSVFCFSFDEVVYRSVGIICIVEDVRDDIQRREEDTFRRFKDHLDVFTV